jgi:hypothetical protein
MITALLLWFSTAQAQEETCGSAFTVSEWREALSATKEALAELNGARADALLAWIYAELRCLDAVVDPNDFGELAALESIVAFYDQDADSAVVWAQAAKGVGAPWPEGVAVPGRLLDLIEEAEPPGRAGPTGVGLIVPKHGAILRNGYFLTSPSAPVGMPGLVQVVDKKGRALSTRWQDGAAFHKDLLGPAGETPKPNWYVPPVVRAGKGGPMVSDQEVSLKGSARSDECPFKADPKAVSAGGNSVKIAGTSFRVKTDEDQAAFKRVLRGCGEYRATRRFMKWREARKKLSFEAGKLRDSMLRALRTPEPKRRRRKG